MITRSRGAGVAVIGAGTMARAHAYGYLAVPLIWSLPACPRLVVLCSRDAAKAERAARSLGFDEFATDWRAVVERADVDVVDICTPPGAHAEVIAAAAAAGKAVICEKPLAARLADATAAAQAVQSAGVLSAIGFNYRRLPAIALMQQMIAEGAIGQPQLWRGTWLSDEFADPSTGFDWRFDRDLGGSTVADLGSHLIDLAEWMIGPITEACAQSVTITGARPCGSDGGTQIVTVDDATSALLRFRGGAHGTLEVAKTCVRRPCDFTIEVNGSTGTLSFAYARLNELRYGTATDDMGCYGMRTIRAEAPSHPYAARWWPLGQGIGYGASFVNQAGELMSAWPDGPWTPDLKTGLRVQQVCAAIESSAAQRAWCAVPGQHVRPGGTRPSRPATRQG
jgi:predicted dehydrogenase